MYVCICHSVTDRQIRKACVQGASTLEDLSQQLKVGTCCGRCADCAKDILDEAKNEYAVSSSLGMAEAVPA